MKKVITLLIISFLAVSQAQYEGDSCRVAHNGETGSCADYRKCPKIIEIYKKKLPITTCSYLSGVAIVCCPIEAPAWSPPVTQATWSLPSNNRPQVPVQTSGRISARKCAQFKTMTVKSTSATDLSLRPKVTTINEEKCEYTTGLIVGGIEAKRGEFPHMAAIGYKTFGNTNYYCGGSVISESFVLTAAHCYKKAYSKRENAPFARIGGLNVNKVGDGENVDIAEFIKHEQYSKTSKQNDIMLVRLARDLTFTLFLRPACLSQESYISDLKAVATGWGATEYAGSNSDVLLKVGLDILDLNLCQTAFEDHAEVIVNNNQICSGILAGKKDTCQGDSGGPLQQVSKDNKCVYEIIGITSFSTPTCASINSPSVYTKVSAYLDWIEAKVWPNQ